MVQEIPEAQSQRDNNNSDSTSHPRNQTRSVLLKYAPASGVLYALTFILSLSNLIGLIVITLPVAVVLTARLIGKINEIQNHETRSALFRIYVTPSASVSAFLFALAIVGIAYTPQYVFDPLVFGFVLALPGLVLMFNAIFLNSFGNWFVKTRETDHYKGLVIKRIAGALGLLFLFALALAAPPFDYFADPFLFSGIAYAILAVSPFLAFSDRFARFRESGQYLMNSTLQWTAVAFLIGIAGAIISLPLSNIFTYVGVLILAMIGVGYVGAKMYYMGAERLNKMQQEVYQKHAHQLQVVNSPDFRFLGNATDAFVSAGQKSSLLIALTTLLANAGLEFNESSALLSNIANYEVPPIYRTPGLSIKKGLDFEIQRRIMIVNSTMYDISQRVGSKRA